VGLLVVTGDGLRHLRRLGFDQAELHGLVAVGLCGLALHDHAWTGLQHRRRLDGPVLGEQLRHADFSADDSGDHGYFPCSFPNALISTSTPAGRSSFISASTVCGVGSKMSMSR